MAVPTRGIGPAGHDDGKTQGFLRQRFAFAGQENGSDLKKALARGGAAVVFGDIKHGRKQAAAKDGSLGRERVADAQVGSRAQFPNQAGSGGLRWKVPSGDR